MRNVSRSALMVADSFRDASANARGIESVLLVETGRGCWWGEKHHCTFCGLNGSTMAFRSKSAERVLDEITTLHQRSGVTTFSVVDNILDMRYFRTLLPHLEKLPLHFSWEVKANLTREQVRQLAAAHIETIQPGIESLSDNVLSLMDKGTTRLQNIQLLKWCKQYGVAPAWNLLFGFPGERTADYEEQLEVVKRIWHLDPPSGWGPVRLDRFSPYFDRPDVYGIVNIRPMAPYPFIYPFDDKILMRIASYFDFDYADGRDPWTYAQPLVDLVTAWQNDPHRGTMYAVERGADLLLVDDPGYLLAAERSSLLRALSDVRSASAKAYQHAAVLLHAGLAVGERASILEMSALLTGANVLSSRLGGWPDRPWHIAWMDVEPQVHRRIGPHDSEVTAVASGVVDGVTLLITGDATGYVRMWDFETGARVGPAKKLVRDPVRHMDALETASGPVVVCRSMRGRVSVWYVERDEVRDIEVAGERIVTTSGIVEGRALLAVGNASGRVELWDVESGTRVMSSQVWTSRPVRMLAFVTVEGQPALVVTAPADMENVWAATSVCVQSLSGRRIAAKVLHGTGVVAALDVDGEPVLVTGQGRDAGPAGVRPFPLRQVAIGTRAAVPVDFDLDGERVLATSLFDLVKLWDLRTGEQLRAIRVESREDLMVDIKPAVLPAGTARWLALPDGRSVTVANVSHALSTAENKRYAGVMGAVVADGVLHVPTVSSVRRLDADTGEQVGDLPVGVVSKIVSGTSVYAITRAAGAFHVLDVHRPKRRWTLDLELSQDSYVVTDEHAEVIVVGSDDRAAYVSPSDGDVRHVRLPRSVSRGGAALVDRRVVLMADVGPSSVGLIDLDSGVVVWERSHRYLLEEIHVGSVDGRQVAVCAASDHSPQILDLRSGDPVGPP
ncbi:RiPP maturation radical SAM C-methyltransferase, partial [Kibdelosporangium lantanae]